MLEPYMLKIKGIKCDNESCDYRDDNVPVEDYCNWLNKACPKCGENLLTQADFNNVKMLMNMAKVFGDMFGDVEPDADQEYVKIEMNGTGGMNITTLKEE